MKSEKFKKQQKIISEIFLIITLLLTLYDLLSAEAIRDRVVAYVGNIAITLSELEKKYSDTLKVSPDITKEQVLNTMINRLLLLREAKKIRLEAPSEDELIRDYIDLKIRAFIRIKDKEMKDFYEQNFDKFQGKEFEAVRDEIEKYLVEKELNLRLEKHINELRENVCVKIRLD